MLATQVVSRLHEVFPVELTLREFLDTPSITQIVEKIEKLMVAKLEVLSDDEVQKLV